MNERIRELVEQAVIAIDNPFPGNPQNDELEKMYIPDCFAEKFAELIVRECCQYLENEAERLYGLSAKEDDPDHKEVYKANFEICAEKCYDNSQGLKDHFGVEE